MPPPQLLRPVRKIRTLRASELSTHARSYLFADDGKGRILKIELRLRIGTLVDTRSRQKGNKNVNREASQNNAKENHHWRGEKDDRVGHGSFGLSRTKFLRQKEIHLLTRLYGGTGRSELWMNRGKDRRRPHTLTSPPHTLSR